MVTQNSVESKVKSALRTLNLLEFVIACKTGVAASEMSTALSIPESSLSYLLATLVKHDYLVREGRLYVPGPGLDRLRQPQADQSLPERAAPIIKALCNQLNETASLFVLAGWELEVVVTEVSSQTLRYSLDVGTRVPLHCVAAGKVLLATMSQKELDRYFAESEQSRFTTKTRHERKEIENELAIIRSQGYARTQDEYSKGISAIGMAVPGTDPSHYSISVAVPTPRFDKEIEKKILPLLKKSVSILSR